MWKFHCTCCSLMSRDRMITHLCVMQCNDWILMAALSWGRKSWRWPLSRAPAGLDPNRLRQAGLIAGQSSTRRIGDYKVKFNYTDIDLLRWAPVLLVFLVFLKEKSIGSSGSPVTVGMKNNAEIWYNIDWMIKQLQLGDLKQLGDWFTPNISFKCWYTTCSLPKPQPSLLHWMSALM